MKTRTHKGWGAALCLLIASSLVALVAVEAAIRYLLDYRRYFSCESEVYWELNFLQSYQPQFPTLGQEEPHPTRGWTPLRDLRLEVVPPVSTNNRGHRSRVDYAYQPDKYTIVALGNSFTWGGEVGDADTWPALLQEKDPRFHVVNLGVSGYGIDQMYITLRETIDEYRPQLSILAFINDDVTRTMLSFRDYRKPKFELSANNELVLTNTPVGDGPDTLAYAKRQLGFPRLMSVLMLKERAVMARLASPEYERERYDLNAAIVREAMRCAQAHQSEFLLTYLPCGLGIASPDVPPDPGERFFEAFIRDNAVTSLATRKAFLDAGRDWYRGHYRRPEAQFFVDLLYAKIQTLPSWQEYLARHKGS